MERCLTWPNYLFVYLHVLFIDSDCLTLGMKIISKNCIFVCSRAHCSNKTKNPDVFFRTLTSQIHFHGAPLWGIKVQPLGLWFLGSSRWRAGPARRWAAVWGQQQHSSPQLLFRQCLLSLADICFTTRRFCFNLLDSLRRGHSHWLDLLIQLVFFDENPSPPSSLSSPLLPLPSPALLSFTLHQTLLPVWRLLLPTEQWGNQIHISCIDTANYNGEKNVFAQFYYQWFCPRFLPPVLCPTFLSEYANMN